MQTYQDSIEDLSKCTVAIQEDVRNEVLLKVADNKDAAGHVARAVSSNFYKLPKNVIQRLIHIWQASKENDFHK